MRWWLAPVVVVALSCGGGATDPPGRDSTDTTPPASTIPPGPYTPGRSYFGRNDYIEYIAGNAPVIYSAPHGGALTPSDIPDRTDARCGGSATTATDLNTVELVHAMQQRHLARHGTYPHIVINHLARRKLDANRTLVEAACGNAAALIALAEWHDFIDVAKAAVQQASSRGWYMDMHGHGHAIQRLELGYLLSSAQLDLPDATLDANRVYQDTASMRTVSEAASISFSALLRGPASLGTMYASNGFPSLPSASDPRPGADAYFTGGDNTRRHGCGAEASALGGSTGGSICGVQVEANFAGVRDTPANRDRFGDVTAVVLQQYLATQWGLSLGPPSSRTATAPSAPSFAIAAGPYTPGTSYFGRNNYIEYVAGNAPVIYSAPHGGNLTPSEIPNRTAANCGGAATTTTDLNTVEFVRAMRARHFARFGTYPHIIINHLTRGKLDANRTILEVACNDAEAQIAFGEWHDFINVRAK